MWALRWFRVVVLRRRGFLRVRLVVVSPSFPLSLLVLVLRLPVPLSRLVLKRPRLLTELLWKFLPVCLLRFPMEVLLRHRSKAGLEEGLEERAEEEEAVY